MKNKISWFVLTVLLTLGFSVQETLAQLASPTLTVTNVALVQDFVDSGVTMVNWGLVGTVVIISLMVVVGIVIAVVKWLKGRR